jgi:hypothetical protein
MRLLALLSGIVAFLVLLVCIGLGASMAFMWERDVISALLSATPKKLLFLIAWFATCSLLAVVLFYLTCEYFKMLLDRGSFAIGPVWTGLAVFGLAFAASAHSGITQLSSMDGLFSFLFAALFGSAIVFHCLWLKRLREAKRSCSLQDQLL